MEQEDTYPPAKILVVDDHPANLLAMTAVLEELGHEIVTARSCQAALRQTAEQEFAVILLDVHLGDGDGFDVLSALQKRPDFGTPVLFLSAVYEAREHAQRAYRLGALDYIVKPFDPDVLRGKVSALVLLHQRGEELKRREEVIARQRALMLEERSRAKAVNDSKDRTLSMVSHDLRNPLNSIAVGAALLQRQLADSPRQHAVASRIARSAKRMEIMIRDLLDYARGRFTGGIPITRSPIDLGEVCAAVLEELTAVHPQRQIVLDNPDNLNLECDGARLEQAISNLVGNALEHSTTTITIAGRTNDAWLEIAVHNGPPAIPAEKLPGLFEAFRTGDQSGGGLGLGLHIVREIARAHGGDVQVVSAADAGTTFTIRLPRA